MDRLKQWTNHLSPFSNEPSHKAKRIGISCYILLCGHIEPWLKLKTATIFSPYQLVHGVESVLPVECKIPSLKLAIDLLQDTSALEEDLVHLEQLDEKHQDSLVALEVNKHHVKVQYDKYVRSRKFSECDLVLL